MISIAFRIATVWACKEPVETSGKLYAFVPAASRNICQNGFYSKVIIKKKQISTVHVVTVKRRRSRWRHFVSLSRKLLLVLGCASQNRWAQHFPRLEPNFWRVRIITLFIIAYSWFHRFGVVLPILSSFSAIERKVSLFFFRCCFEYSGDNFATSREIQLGKCIFNSSVVRLLKTTRRSRVLSWDYF